MPPRFAYWTIILDGAPTSFRAKDREEILPLFNQLKAKNPGALLKWFSGGTLWDSPEQAREARELQKVRRFREERSQQMRTGRGPGPSHPGAPRAHGEERAASGEDPLAEFRRQHGRPADGSDDPSTRQAPRWSPGSSHRPNSGQADPGSPNAHRDDRPSRPAAPRVNRPGEGRADRRGKDWRPGGEHRDPADKYKLPPGEARKRWKERNLGPRGPKPFGSKPAGDRPWSDKPRGPKPFGSKPAGDRPWSDKPRGPKPFGSRPSSGRPRGPKPFGPRPGGGRPRGGKPPGGSRGKR